MEENHICRGNSLLYELYAGFLEAKENWKEAYMVYQTGILRLLPLVFCVFLCGLFCTFLCHWYWVVDLYRDDRKAEPLERLERAKVLFLDRLSYRINASSLQKVCILTQGKKLCFLRFFFWFSFIHMYHRLGKWLEIHKLKFRWNLVCSAIFLVVGISVHILLLDTEEYLVPHYNRSASLLKAMPNCLCESIVNETQSFFSFCSFSSSC